MDPTVGVILGAGLSAAAAVIASYITSKRAQKATEGTNLLAWANQLRESEQAARSEAIKSRERADRIKDEADADVEQLRGKLDELQTQLRMATAAAARLTDTLISVAAEVWRPEPDIGALRRLVGRPDAPTVNGRPLG